MKMFLVSMLAMVITFSFTARCDAVGAGFVEDAIGDDEAVEKAIDRVGGVEPSADSDAEAKVERLVEGIHWLGHDTFYVIENIAGREFVIYFDPWKIRKGHPLADLILVTHEHQDHCSIDDINKVRKAETKIIASPAAAEKINANRLEAVSLAPGGKMEFGGIAIKAVPAYNVSKFSSPGVPFHPNDGRKVGFVIDTGKRTIYHMGDTDIIPEMDGLSVDVLFIPVSGIYVMTADEAVECLERVRAGVAIPMHVGKTIGSMNDAVKFARNAPSPARVLKLEE